MTTPSEDFLLYKVEGISKDSVLKSKESKEITIYLETITTKNWGHNFNEDLEATVYFEKTEIEPEEEVKNEIIEDKPVVDDSNTGKNEIVNDSNIGKNEIIGEKPIVDNNTNKDETIVTKPNNGSSTKPIVGGNSKPNKNETIVEQPNTNDYSNIIKNEIVEPEEEEKEDIIIEDNDVEEEIEDNEEKNNTLTTILIVGALAIGIPGIGIVLYRKNKMACYIFLIITLSSTLSFTKAEDAIKMSVKINARYVTQNIMKPAYTLVKDGKEECQDYWCYAEEIKTFNIDTEFSEIEGYSFKFDVSESNDGSTLAYLVKNKEDNNFYDLYLQADGAMHLAIDSSYYFGGMTNLESIINIYGIDTSNVENMKYMFYQTGKNSDDFKLDLGDYFYTGKIIDASYMFYQTGYNSKEFTLDLSDENKEDPNAGDKFSTHNVTDMSHMFNEVGYKSNKLDILIWIRNSGTSIYDNMFLNAATKGESKITVDYRSDTSSLVDQMINTKSVNSNVVKGSLREW